MVPMTFMGMNAGPQEGWATVRMRPLRCWPRRAVSRLWATPPSRPSTSPMPVCPRSPPLWRPPPTHDAVLLLLLLPEYCCCWSGRTFFGIQSELESTRSLNFEENIAHATDCYLSAIKVCVCRVHLFHLMMWESPQLRPACTLNLHHCRPTCHRRERRKQEHFTTRWPSSWR